MASEEKQPKKRDIPWLMHFLVLGLSGGAIAFFAPFLIPMVAGLYGTFAALSTILFPICRRSRTLFLLNYIVSAAVALVLFFRG